MMIFLVPWATRTWTTARPMGPPPRTRTEALVAPMSRSGDAETACQATERGSTSAVVLSVFLLHIREGGRTSSVQVYVFWQWQHCIPGYSNCFTQSTTTTYYPLSAFFASSLIPHLVSLPNLPLKPINPPLAHAFSTPFLQAPQL
jgi:hypothetical protein